MVKHFFIALVSFGAIAAEVPHAILNADKTLIVGFRQFDPSLWDQYITQPSQSNKVGWLRLVVSNPPTPETGFKVAAAGTNINDGGWTLTASNVTRVWNMVPLTSEEITALNTETANEISDELETRLRGQAWERSQTRLIALLSEYTGLLTDALFENTRQLQLVTRAVAATSATNNLTVGERAELSGLRTLLTGLATDGQLNKARALTIQGELIKAYQLWQAAKSNRLATLSATNVVSVQTNWPSLEIGE